MTYILRNLEFNSHEYESYYLVVRYLKIYEDKGGQAYTSF